MSQLTEILQTTRFLGLYNQLKQIFSLQKYVDRLLNKMTGMGEKEHEIPF